jgi:hypothetical protein
MHKCVYLTVHITNYISKTSLYTFSTLYIPLSTLSPARQNKQTMMGQMDDRMDDKTDG